MSHVAFQRTPAGLSATVVLTAEDRQALEKGAPAQLELWAPPDAEGHQLFVSILLLYEAPGISGKTTAIFSEEALAAALQQGRLA